MKDLGKSIGSGVISGFVGSLCCTGPLILVLLGISSVSGAMAISGNLANNYRWTIFIPLATLFLVSSIYLNIKRKENVCNLNTIKHYKTYVISTVIFAIIMWILLLYVIVPKIFGIL